MAAPGAIPLPAPSAEAHDAAEHQALVLESLQDAVIGLDPALAVTSWNAAAARLLECPREAALGRTLTEVLPEPLLPDKPPAEVARLARVTGAVTAVLRRSTNGVQWQELDCCLQPLRSPNQTLRGYVLICRDVSGQRRSQRLQRAHQQRMARILTSASEGVLILDRRGRLEFANPRVGELLGRPRHDLMGRDLAELVPAALRPAVEADLAALAQGERARRELRFPAPGGGARVVLFSWTPLRDRDGAPVTGAVGIFVDVTEQRRVEQDQDQETRLEAVGRLAAGIAHEINTPIQYIGDSTTFLGDGLAALADFARRVRAAAGPESPRVEALAAELDVDYLLERIPATLDRTRDGVNRVATIVRAMKEFAHQDQREMVPTDLNRALTNTLEVARNEYKYHADVKLDLGELPAVTCRPGEVNQLLLNLIVNAAHAMADANAATGGRGVLGVRTVADEDGVVIEISDTGTGIPEDIQPKIFDPFFTTKEVGRGTGQGLAIARRVVTRHGGSLTFTTAVGSGTTFRVRLPARPPARAERP